MAHSHEDGVCSPTSESGMVDQCSVQVKLSSHETLSTGPSDPTKPRSTSVPSQGARHSGIPVKTTPSKPSSDQSGYQRQVSADSLEENFQELDRSLNDLLKQDDRKERAIRNGDSHIEEWLKHTSKDAVPPEMGEVDDPPLSPTFTDNSLSYSQTVSTCIIAVFSIIIINETSTPVPSESGLGNSQK